MRSTARAEDEPAPGREDLEALAVKVLGDTIAGARSLLAACQDPARAAELRGAVLEVAGTAEKLDELREALAVFTKLGIASSHGADIGFENGWKACEVSGRKTPARGRHATGGQPPLLMAVDSASALSRTLRVSAPARRPRRNPASPPARISPGPLPDPR
jgi:hypothetical protein